jgi:hypothetical protein
MIIARELLFGQIAVSMHFISQPQLDECLSLQKNPDFQMPIGKILLQRGYITPGNVDEILKTQESIVKDASSYAPGRKSGDSLFGKMAVTMKYTTLSQVIECMKEQDRLERLNIHIRLGEIFLSKRYLTVEQVRELIARQKHGV